MILSDLGMYLDKIYARSISLRDAREAGLRKLESYQKEAELLNERLTNICSAIEFLTAFANEKRNYAKESAQSLIREAVGKIYGEGIYDVILDYSLKQNRSCLDIKLRKKTPFGEVTRDVLEGNGGGMVDSISVPFRFLFVLADSQLDKVVVLDESWKHIDANRVAAVGEFLRDVSHKLKLQIIMVTHLAALREYADAVYTVSQEDGISRVSKE